MDGQTEIVTPLAPGPDGAKKEGIVKLLKIFPIYIQSIDCY